MSVVPVTVKLEYRPVGKDDLPHFTHFYANDVPAHPRAECSLTKCGERPIAGKLQDGLKWERP